MGKTKKFYAVAIGRRTGIFDTWAECQQQTTGYRNAKFKSFKTVNEAEEFIFMEQSKAAAEAALMKEQQQQQQHKKRNNMMNGGDEFQHDSDMSMKRRKKLQQQQKQQQQQQKQRRPSSVGGGGGGGGGGWAEHDDNDDDSRYYYQDLHIYIQFDGGSRGNPGISGAGAVITLLDPNPPIIPPSSSRSRVMALTTTATTATKSRKRTTIKIEDEQEEAVLDADANDEAHVEQQEVEPFRRVIQVREYLGHCQTNNQAEYRGILSGLSFANHEAMQYLSQLKQQKQLQSISNSCDTSKYLRLNIKLVIQGDSDLIIRQLKGEYQCRNERLKPLYKRTVNIINGFHDQTLGRCHATYEHLYRNNNTLADSLANAAMDGKRSWFTTSDDNHEMQHQVPPTDLPTST